MTETKFFNNIKKYIPLALQTFGALTSLIVSWLNSIASMSGFFGGLLSMFHSYPGVLIPLCITLLFFGALISRGVSWIWRTVSGAKARSDAEKKCLALSSGAKYVLWRMVNGNLVNQDRHEADGTKKELCDADLTIKEGTPSYGEQYEMPKLNIKYAKYIRENAHDWLLTNNVKKRIHQREQATEYLEKVLYGLSCAKINILKKLYSISRESDKDSIILPYNETTFSLISGMKESGAISIAVSKDRASLRIKISHGLLAAIRNSQDAAETILKNISRWEIKANRRSRGRGPCVSKI